MRTATMEPAFLCGHELTIVEMPSGNGMLALDGKITGMDEVCDLFKASKAEFAQFFEFRAGGSGNPISFPKERIVSARLQLLCFAGYLGAGVKEGTRGGVKKWF